MFTYNGLHFNALQSNDAQLWSIPTVSLNLKISSKYLKLPTFYILGTVPIEHENLHNVVPCT